MNKIFFRIWDKVNKQMINDVHICPEYGWLVMSDNDALSEMMGRVNPNDLVWMQYTGLKDKNGVDIYEGDICKGNGHIEKDNEQFIIKYGKYKTKEWKEKYFNNTYQFGWYAEFVKNKEQVHLVTPNGIEVMGNIYEESK